MVSVAARRYLLMEREGSFRDDNAMKLHPFDGSHFARLLVIWHRHHASCSMWMSRIFTPHPLNVSPLLFFPFWK